MHGHYSLVTVSVRDADDEEVASGFVEVRARRGKLLAVTPAAFVAICDGSATHARCYWPPADVETTVAFDKAVQVIDGKPVSLTFPDGCVLSVVQP